jgi:hypothetical protein
MSWNLPFGQRLSDQVLIFPARAPELPDGITLARKIKPRKKMACVSVMTQASFRQPLHPG